MTAPHQPDNSAGGVQTPGGGSATAFAAAGATDRGAYCAHCGAAAGPRTLYCRECGHRGGGDAGAGEDRVPEPAGAAERSTVLLPTRPPTAGLVAVAVVTGILLALTLPLVVVRGVLYTPEDTVERFFAALSDRDADAAWEQVDGGGTRSTTNPLLSNEALGDPGYTPPEKVSVTDVDIEGKAATVAVEYEVAGGPMTGTLQLRRGGEDTGLIDRWRLSAGFLLSLPVVSGDPDLRIAGRTLPDDGSYGTSAEALPGAYRLSLADSALLEVVPAVVIAGTPAGDGVTRQLKAGVDEKIRVQVRAWLDRCVQSTQVDPPGCPFGYSPYTEVQSISWQLTAEPDVRIEPDGSNTDAVPVYGSVEVRATGRTDSVFDPTFDYQDTFQFMGVAEAVGEDVRFTPDSTGD